MVSVRGPIPQELLAVLVIHRDLDELDDALMKCLIREVIAGGEGRLR